MDFREARDTAVTLVEAKRKEMESLQHSVEILTLTIQAEEATHQAQGKIDRILADNKKAMAMSEAAASKANNDALVAQGKLSAIEDQIRMKWDEYNRERSAVESDAQRRFNAVEKARGELLEKLSADLQAKHAELKAVREEVDGLQKTKEQLDNILKAHKQVG